MEWTESLSVGVQEIDEQHKELINRVNAFSDAMKKGTANSQVMEVLMFLEAYVVRHFKDEEALQVKYNYPNYLTHRQIHKDFIQTVKEMHASIENGFTAASASMVSMTLTSWLLLHINKEDKAIGAYLKSKNLINV